MSAGFRKLRGCRCRLSCCCALCVSHIGARHCIHPDLRMRHITLDSSASTVEGSKSVCWHCSRVLWLQPCLGFIRRRHNGWIGSLAQQALGVHSYSTKRN